VPHSSNWVGATADLIRYRFGLSSNDEARQIDWWTDETCIESMKRIIDQLLERTNSINGIKYSEDSTILAWETGAFSSISLNPSSLFLIFLLAHLLRDLPAISLTFLHATSRPSRPTQATK
jgi:hypothetical protein